MAGELCPMDYFKESGPIASFFSNFLIFWYQKKDFFITSGEFHS